MSGKTKADRAPVYKTLSLGLFRRMRGFCGNTFRCFVRQHPFEGMALDLSVWLFNGGPFDILIETQECSLKEFVRSVGEDYLLACAKFRFHGTPPAYLLNGVSFLS